MNGPQELPPERSPRCTFCGAVLERPSREAHGLAPAPCPRCGHAVWFAWIRPDETLEIRILPSRTRSPGLVDPLDNGRGGRRPRRIVIDLKGVRRLPSAYVARMVLLARTVAPGGRVTVRNLDPDLREVFLICRLDHLFTLD